MSRFAAIDVGTNSVLLLVADRDQNGVFRAVLERSDITRLGKGVDRTGVLSSDALEATLRTVEKFAHEAREFGALEIAVSATSAARDAANGSEFLEAAKKRARVLVEIITGDEEARLSFASAHADFKGPGPLIVLDIGGGSTEFIFGNASGAIEFRKSFNVGAVRLTERFIANDPPTPAELSSLSTFLTSTFAELPRPPSNGRMVGVAGTVTSIAAIAHHIVPYDGGVVHGSALTSEEVVRTVQRLAALPTELRRTVPGLQPARADVIVAGGLILQLAMEAMGASSVTVSDRGLRWGLLVDRFGKPKP